MNDSILEAIVFAMGIVSVAVRYFPAVVAGIVVVVGALVAYRRVRGSAQRKFALSAVSFCLLAAVAVVLVRYAWYVSDKPQLDAAKEQVLVAQFVAGTANQNSIKQQRPSVIAHKHRADGIIEYSVFVPGNPNTVSVVGVTRAGKQPVFTLLCTIPADGAWLDGCKVGAGKS